jgi:aldose 1-epimerase
VSLFTFRVTSPDASTTAEFVPDAGMLCCSLEHGGEQLLDLGRGLAAYAAHGHTMGIPLLYPWANRLDRHQYHAAGKSVTFPDDRAITHADPNGLPIHGAIPGLMRWTPEDRRDDAALAAELRWVSPSPELEQLFPFAHEVRLEAVVAPGALAIATTVRASGRDEVPISFGFHPYLRLPEGGRERWRVKLPALERLVLDARMIPTGAREPVTETDFELAGASWDDGFVVDGQPARFEVVAPSGRGIALELLEGYPYAQVYAPRGHDFICFEPMTAPTNALRSGDGLTVLSPGQEYRAVFRVSAW